MKRFTLAFSILLLLLAVTSVNALQEYNDFGTVTANMTGWFNTTGGNSTDFVKPLICTGVICNISSGFAVTANHSSQAHYGSYQLVNAYGESVNISFQLIGRIGTTLAFGSNLTNLGEGIRMYCQAGNSWAISNKSSADVATGHTCDIWRNITIIMNMSTQRFTLRMGGNVTLPITPLNDTLNVSFIRMSGYSSTPGTPNISIDQLFIQGFNDTTQVRVYNESSRTLITNQNVYITIFNSLLSRTATTSNGIATLAPLTTATSESYTMTASGTNTTALPQRLYYLLVPPANIFQQDVYLLDGNLATQLRVTVKDEYGNLIENATISLKRYYPEINDYKTVQQIRTNNNGQGDLYAEFLNPLYVFSVEYNDKVVYVSQPQALFINTYTINVVLGTPFFKGYNTFTHIEYTHTYDTTNDRFAFTWNDRSQSITQTCIRVTRTTYYSTTQVSENCSSAFSGVLYSPSVNENLTGDFASIVTTRINSSDYRLTTINKDFTAASKASTWGSLGFFMTFFIIVVLVTMSLWSPAMVMIMAAVGLMVSVTLGWVAVTYGTLIGLVIAIMVLVFKVGR